MGRHQPCLAQDTQVVGDRGLRQPAAVCEVAGADLATPPQLRENGQPRLVGQGLEQPCCLLELCVGFFCGQARLAVGRRICLSHHDTKIPQILKIVNMFSVVVFDRCSGKTLAERSALQIKCASRRSQAAGMGWAWAARPMHLPPTRLARRVTGAAPVPSSRRVRQAIDCHKCSLSSRTKPRRLLRFSAAFGPVAAR